MASYSYSFSLPEVLQYCRETQEVLQPEEELKGTLTQDHISYWSAFITRTNEEWRAVTQNSSYFSQQVMDTVVLLNSVREVQAIVKESKAISAMLWIREGLRAQPTESPLKSSASSSSPWLTPFRSPNSYQLKQRHNRQKSPMVPTTRSLTHLDRSFSDPKFLSPNSLSEDISARCEKALSEKAFSGPEIEFWREFIKQADIDWKTAINNDVYWNHEVMETLLMLKEESRIWLGIEKSPATLAILWIYIGLCTEAERTSTGLSSPFKSPLKGSSRGSREISSHVKRSLAAELEKDERIADLERQLKEARETSICSWPVAAVCFASFALGVLSTSIWNSPPSY